MITSSEEFVKLLESNNPRARHDEASIDVWLEVIDKYPEYSEWVVLNKKVPLKILEILSDSKIERVRFVIAMKRKCTPELLKKFSTDPDFFVRWQVARHFKTPKEVLQVLSTDSEEEIASIARGRIE